MFCSNCGKEISDNVNFCSWCGNKLSINISSNSTVQKEIKIPKPYIFPIAFDCSIAFDAKFHQYNKIRSEFYRQGSSNEIKGEMIFREKCRTFDDVFNTVLPWSVGKIKEGIDYAISLLMKFGIDYIDKKTLTDEITDRAGEIGVFNELDNAEKIIDELKQRLNYSNNNYHWMGGGFGITGAIKGAITAEVMNIGTNALVDVAKSITGNTNDDKINRAKSKLFEEINLIGCCTRSITTMYMETFYVMHKILVSNKLMPSISFDEKKALGKFNNIKSMYEREQLTKKQAVAGICECIEIYPYNLAYYLYVYQLSMYCEENLHKITEYLGMKESFMIISELVIDANRWR